MSVKERLVRLDGKREQRIPGCKAEKAKRAKGSDHNGAIVARGDTPRNQDGS